MDETLSVRQETRGSCRVIKLTGALAAKNILEIRALFDEILKSDHRKIALDLSAVNYLDSMGVGILINFNKRVAKNHGRMAVINPSQVVSEIFDVADTDKYLTVRNVDSANIDSVFD